MESHVSILTTGGRLHPLLAGFRADPRPVCRTATPPHPRPGLPRGARGRDGCGARRQLVRGDSGVGGH
ncbi:hypothetical protein [Streptomyces sp. NPDC056160]|uniref:hypothetical protein n=1 Tax=Streptomyces sp. NPDC056160 TaxID=3345731 RepID=UPI0035DF86F4